MMRTVLVFFAFVDHTVVLGQQSPAQRLPAGVVIESVVCDEDHSQSYALYLPSAYRVDSGSAHVSTSTPARRWSVLVGFHPGARGRAIVEKYQAAAEQYGYIVAGSNNSRNGPWAVSAAAVKAVFADLSRRFPLDPARVYLTGHSGGARVAMQVALQNKAIAGVIASSAGFPDATPRASVPFAIFGTAGSEDFNFIEMRSLDRKLTSPHRLVIFDGGHTLPPDDVALEALEWMELQSMKTGARQRDEALIARLFEKRQAAILNATDSFAALRLIDAFVTDFDGLRDVSAESSRAKGLAKQPDVKKAVDRERSADNTETAMLREVFDLEAGLRDDNRRDESLMLLRARLAQWSKVSRAEQDSPDRSQARRVLRAIAGGASERVRDEDYRKLLEQYAPEVRRPR